MSLLTQTAPVAAPASHPSAEATPGSFAVPPAQRPAQRPAAPRRAAHDHVLSPLSARARAARIHERPPQPATTLAIPTPHGPARGLWRPSSQRHAAVLLLPDADNLLDGPDGLFDALAPMLQRAAAVAQLAYPCPGDLDACRDVMLAALGALNRCGIERAALIGWGFGAAVAASVAASSPLVTGLVCLPHNQPITDAGERDALLERLARWASATLRSPFRPARHSLALNGR